MEWTLEQKAEEFKDVLKMGRTENQDGVSMTLGQEFSAHAVMTDNAIQEMGLGADERVVFRTYVENSIGLVTAVVPVLGYEQSAAIAKEALKTGGSVYNLILEKGLLSKEQLDDMLRPENMTDPREIPTNHHG